MRIRAQRRNGLSFVELAFVLATVALLILVLLPGFRRTSAPGSMRSRLGCTSNLKQVGLGYRIWSTDNGDRFPFFVSNHLGGTLEFANSPEVFRHFATLSNQLVSPKILVCPQDKNRSCATNFATFSNSNLSYFVGLDADEAKPERLLSGDRNITGGTLSNDFLRLLQTNTSAGWTREIHIQTGNVGLADGSVLQTTPNTLRKQLHQQTLSVIRLAIP